MFILRHIQADDKLYDQLDGHLFSSIFSPEDIDSCSAQFPSSTQRRLREFTSHLLFYLLLMHALWSRRSWLHAWEKMAHAFSDLHPSGIIHTCSHEAISEQRALFDVRILHRLMQRCCHPLCDPKRHPGAFYHGRRLIAIDGTKFNVADTPANSTAFGRTTNQYGKGAFPQIQAIVLMECGSRAVFDLHLQPYAEGEVHALPVLLERLPAGSLLLGDAAYASAWVVEQLQDTIKADLLCALGSTACLKIEKRLCDGSYLTTMSPNHRKGPMRGTRPVQVRVIEYTLSDERLGEPGRCYRLLTTLLDAEVFPAKDLIDLYHERWEAETMLDESKTHLRDHLKMIRSWTPEGVKQEVYALFLMHYVISFLKLQAADERGVDPDRISFTNAVVQIQDTIGDSLRYDPSCHDEVISRLIRRIAVATLLPKRRLRMNPREIKLFYQKHKPKKRNVPAPKPFDPDDVFLDFVEVWVRPADVRPTGKHRGKKNASTTIVQQEVRA